MWLRKSGIVILFLCSSWGISAQEFTTKLEGRIYSKDADVAATHVSNISSKKGTITDAQGFFSISVRLNDTLVFSAIQYKRKEVVVTLEVLKTDLFNVPLEPSLTELDEVVVTPYNLSGDLKRDIITIKVENIVTASTLGLPNANVKVISQNERRLFEADNGKFISLGNYKLDSTFNPMIMVNLNKILNRVTGRTQKLKKFVAIDKEIAMLQKVKRLYPDSLFVQDLKIPETKINDFMNFCEVDSTYNEVVEGDDILNIWEFLYRNSLVYRKNNALD
jgi:hypothetical protein